MVVFVLVVSLGDVFCWLISVVSELLTTVPCGIPLKWVRLYMLTYIYIYDFSLVSQTRLMIELQRLQLKIVGEIEYDVPRYLCTIPNGSFSRLNCIISDIGTLGECEKFIQSVEERNATVVNRQATWDSAAGCQSVRLENASTVGVIASRESATMNGLIVLEKIVIEQRDANIRYVVVGHESSSSLVVSHTPEFMWTTCEVRFSSFTNNLFNVVKVFDELQLPITELALVCLNVEEGCMCVHATCRVAAHVNMKTNLLDAMAHIGAEAKIIGVYSRYICGCVASTFVG
jgi:prephenate dehydratase